MHATPMEQDLDQLLEQSAAGDEKARDRVFAFAYPELLSLARARLRDGGRSVLLDTAVLVQESFVRLMKAGQLRASSRGPFFAYASRVMRSVIVDFARQRLAERRGGKGEIVPLTTTLGEGLSVGEEEIVRIHEALEDLRKLDERLASVVEMRFFGGLTADEVASALGVSTRTVERDWEKARLVLDSLV